MSSWPNLGTTWAKSLLVSGSPALCSAHHHTNQAVIALEGPSKRSDDAIRTSLNSFLLNSTQPFTLGCSLLATGFCFETLVSPFRRLRCQVVIGIVALFLVSTTSSSLHGRFVPLARRCLLFGQVLLAASF